MSWRKNTGPLFPAPLQEFVEAEWPPVDGECLQCYGCFGEGYGRECCPRPGSHCGEAHYEMLEAWAMTAPWHRADPAEAPALSRAELANREAISRRSFAPATRCGVCWRCQLGGDCDVYR